MKTRIAAIAILMCAIMALVAAAPLVTADTHHIVKGAQGPRASAVSWTYLPTENGGWFGHVVNSGLRSLVVDVDDVTSGVANSILHQRIRFAAYPSPTLDTEKAVMTAGHIYTITATPNGPRETFCDVEDNYVPLFAPVAAFSSTVNGMTVSVDASASTDSDGTIVAYGWDWDDGLTGTGVTTTHTYAASGTYHVVLTVIDNDGLTNSVTHDVVIAFVGLPVPSFTGVVASGGKLSVNASASTAPAGIYRYDWNFGDHIISWGVTHDHIYVATGTYTVTLTVTDLLGQKASISQSFNVVNTALPPLPYTVYGYATNGGSPVAGAQVNVTNVRTSETMIDFLSLADGLYYMDNIMPLYFLTGDTAVFAAASGALSGEVSIVLDLTGVPYLEVDIPIA